jgi:hypothetical protein
LVVAAELELVFDRKLRASRGNFEVAVEQFVKLV